jgi:hypothetical protein
MVFFLLISTVWAECVFTQVTPGVPPIKINPIPAFDAKWTAPPACPEFVGQKVCCSDGQNNAMLYKYLLLDSTFGHAVGGCDMCSANMKRMWCYFTCSPRQSEFVSPGPQVVVPSPVDGHPTLIMLNNFTVTNTLSCQLYESCKKCPYVTEVSAMQSPEGFLQFQGYEAIPIGLLWTTFYFNDGPLALNLTLMNCLSNVKEAYGYPVVPCSCNNCEQRCAADYYVSSPSTLHGVDWALIGFFYLGLLVFSIIVLFVQWRISKRRQKIQEVSRGNSLMVEMEESK